VVAPRGSRITSNDEARKGRELIDWYLAIWRGEKEPLGRIPKPAERFEAARRSWPAAGARPPQYVDLALASTEVKGIEVNPGQKKALTLSEHRFQEFDEFLFRNRQAVKKWPDEAP
jgi:hypothetical protein